MRHAKRPAQYGGPWCRGCGCEITHAEANAGNGLCFICARNHADREALRKVD